MQSKFSWRESCRVKRLQMSEGVTLCWGLHYTAKPEEGDFFHISIVPAWTWLQSRALLLTDFIYKHLQAAQTSVLKVQQLVSASVQWRETICQNKFRRGRVCVRHVSCTWVIFDVTNISPVDGVWEMCDILYTSSSFAHHLLKRKVSSEVSASLVKTQPHVWFYNKKQPLT